MVKRRGTEWRDEPYEALGSSTTYSSKKMNIIIFSKDRAPQLDLLLRSMERNVDKLCHQNVFVVFKASSREFADGYRKTVADWGRKDKGTGYVTWLNEDASSFKQRLLDIFQTEEVRSNPFTMFLVDDIVFTHEFSNADEEFDFLLENKDLLGLSLRLDPQKTYCYAIDQEMKVPESLHTDFLCYPWHGKDGDFGYPMSVDGTVFRTNEILPLVQNLHYWNPNAFEAALSQHPIQRPHMLAYKQAKLVNIPVNRTQDTFNNRHANLEEAQLSLLNKEYLDGKKIDYEPFDKLQTPSVHFETDYSYNRTTLEPI